MRSAFEQNGLTPSPTATLDRLTTEGVLWREEGNRVRCVACGHRCLLTPGRRGICKVRYNDAGRLRVPFGYVAGGLACDPVEKKPFFHVYPGCDALTFGMRFSLQLLPELDYEPSVTGWFGTPAGG